MVQKLNLPKEQVRQMVRGCFHDLAESVDAGFAPETSEPQAEAAEQVAIWGDLAANVRDQLSLRKFGHPVEGLAIRTTQGAGIHWESVSQNGQQDLMSGVARALLEQQRLFLHRLNDQLMPFTPQDPLFAAEAEALPTSPQVTSPAAPHLGPTVGEVAQDYLERGKGKWAPKTVASRKVRIDYLVEFLGGQRPLAGVTAADVREFRNAVSRLRNTRAKGVGTSFAARQTDNADHRIAPKTAALIFETAKAFFRWAKSKQGYIAANPAEDIEVDVPKVKKAGKARRPFRPDELEVLFRAPLFTGHLSANRRHDPGGMILKDARYWLPILGFYTGARLGELVQLHRDDVHLEGPIPFLVVTDENGGEPGSDDAKSVKTQAGVREVPLHPDVIGLGFGEFVAKRRSQKRSSKRLFWEVAFGADSQASTTYSKWFARFLDKAGLTDPALVFHSFRHNAEDSFRNALLPQPVIDRIIGHSDGSTSAGYGEGVWLETAYDAVQAMKLRVDLLAILRPKPK